ncbi:MULTISPECIES: FliA/WhiG family RNA polymerase sigma factor [Clostridium]|uniref:RNA polymerase sigma-D factor n=2 Tax=Clostridium TaxID=1485 RepID=A0A6V8SJY5_9CLOT|nr:MULTISPECIES: FliA/WhiG family RNA polymerase sigma factor [Clostridium]GFP77076.1 RNA polymerase sigma-D factor [Clostridium fungisolvens]GKU23592.1 RNA polymerase sigma factor [Clostridium folliculivorans]GKU29708.1 RNA polymerase sigma factor [Clostridium folliculivorans]
MAVQGALAYRDKIVEKYIPLVKYIASRVILGKSKYVEYDDLVGYGMVGLMDAMNKFDESKGMKFSTYASIRIKGAMIDEIRRNSPISKGAMDKLNRYNEVIDSLQKSLGKEPSNEEIAKALNMSLESVGEIENYINYISIVSLENIIFSDDDDISIMGIIEDKNSPSPEKTLEEKEEVEMLSKALGLLNEKDGIVLSLYYYEGLTLKEIGKVLEVSESRVCQLHSRAIRNLRAAMKKLHYI